MKAPLPVYIEDLLLYRWPSVRSCSQQRRRVNVRKDKGANNWKITIHVLSFILSAVHSRFPACGTRHRRHRSLRLPWQLLNDRGKYWIHDKEVDTYLNTELPDIRRRHPPRRHEATVVPQLAEAPCRNASGGMDLRPVFGLKRRTRRRRPSGPRSVGRPRSFVRGRKKRTQIVSRKADKEDGV